MSHGICFGICFGALLCFMRAFYCHLIQAFWQTVPTVNIAMDLQACLALNNAAIALTLHSISMLQAAKAAERPEHRGFAFVTFRAKAAVMTILGDRPTAIVNLPGACVEVKRVQKTKGSSDYQRKIFVGGLPCSIHCWELLKVFQKYACVVFRAFLRFLDVDRLCLKAL